MGRVLGIVIALSLGLSRPALACTGACCLMPRQEVEVLGIMDAGVLVRAEIPECTDALEDDSDIRSIRVDEEIFLIARGNPPPKALFRQVPGARLLQPLEMLYYWTRDPAHRALVPPQAAAALDEGRLASPKLSGVLRPLHAGRTATRLTKVADERGRALDVSDGQNRLLVDFSAGGAFSKVVSVEALLSDDRLPYFMVKVLTRNASPNDPQGDQPQLFLIAWPQSLKVAVFDGLSPTAPPKARAALGALLERLQRAGFASIDQRKAQQPHSASLVLVPRPAALMAGRPRTWFSVVESGAYFDAGLRRLNEAVLGRNPGPRPRGFDAVDMGWLPEDEMTWNAKADLGLIIGDDIDDYVSGAKLRAIEQQ